MLLISSARESARRDPLTGVYDEPHLHDQLRRLAAAARQYAEPFALVLMHVPRRHADEALGRLVGTARELDLVARLDDGRLAVVLARISAPGAAEAAERLRAGVRTAADRRRRRLAAGRHGRRRRRARRSSCSTRRRSWAATTRAGRRQDVLVNGHPRLGVTAFSQLLELAAAIDAALPDRPGALPQGRTALPRPRARARAEAGGGRRVVPRRPAARARDAPARRVGAAPARSADGARRESRAPPRHARRRARRPDPVRGPRRQDRGELRGALGRLRARAACGARRSRSRHVSSRSRTRS